MTTTTTATTNATIESNVEFIDELVNELIDSETKTLKQRISNNTIDYTHTHWAFRRLRLLSALINERG